MASSTSAADSARELSWLISGTSEVLRIPETRIDPDRTLWESELDSITIVELTLYFRCEHGIASELLK